MISNASEGETPLCLIRAAVASTRVRSVSLFQRVAITREAGLRRCEKCSVIRLLDWPEMDCGILRENDERMLIAAGITVAAGISG